MPKKPIKTAKKAVTTRKKSVSSVKLVESFIRDLSLECFLPPSAHPAKERQMDFTLSRAIRQEGKNRTCVNIAMQVRISPQSSVPFVVAEMIFENVYNATVENKQDEAWINGQGSQETYAKARKTLLDVLAHGGVNPPLPATVDFSKMSQQGNVSKK
jgi:preprotein translocase subunit SecB